MKTRFPGNYPNDAAVYTLQDFTPPTDEEVAGYLSDGLNEFGDQGIVPVNARLLDLTALGDTSGSPATPLRTYSTASYLVKSTGNESITVNYKSDSAIHMRWNNTHSVCTEYYDHTGSVTDWTSVSFTADEAGTYYLGIASGSGVTSIEIPDHPAALIVDPHNNLFKSAGDGGGGSDPWWYAHPGGDAEYFYVPAGTDKFTFHATHGGPPNFDVTGSLVDPDGVSHPFTFDNLKTFNDDYVTITSPIAGLWKLNLDATATYQHFWFVGIPPLVWYDPEYLLVPDSGTEQPPVLNPIGNKTGSVGQSLTFTISATDPNGDTLAYSASNLPAWATFDAATRTFSGTPNEAATYNNVHFQVSDGVMTDSEDISINVITGVNPDVNGDGLVNILDIISIVQHWGETGLNGWIAEDVNSDGEINVLDVVIVSQYWTP